MDQLRAEDWEESPYLLFIVKDEDGAEVLDSLRRFQRYSTLYMER